MAAWWSFEFVSTPPTDREGEVFAKGNRQVHVVKSPTGSRFHIMVGTGKFSWPLYAHCGAKTGETVARFVVGMAAPAERLLFCKKCKRKLEKVMV